MEDEMRIVLLLTLITFFSSYGITTFNIDKSIPENHTEETITVKNILIKEFNKNKIISTNGKVYKLPSDIKVIKNYKKKPIIAELHFKNNKLIFVILK